MEEKKEEGKYQGIQGTVGDDTPQEMDLKIEEQIDQKMKCLYQDFSDVAEIDISETIFDHDGELESLSLEIRKNCILGDLTKEFKQRLFIVDIIPEFNHDKTKTVTKKTEDDSLLI